MSQNSPPVDGDKSKSPIINEETSQHDADDYYIPPTPMPGFDASFKKKVWKSNNFNENWITRKLNDQKPNCDPENLTNKYSFLQQNMFENISKLSWKC